MTGCLWGQEELRESPFLPSGFGKSVEEVASGGSLDKIELRGIMSVDGIYSFSLFDSSIGRGFWVDIDESVQGVTIVSFDEISESVTIKEGGKTRALKLKEAKIIALKITSLPSSGKMQPTVTAQGGQSKGTINQLSDDQVRDRMKNVATEIRRRRAARRAIIEKNNAKKASGNP
ncbi:MAG: hypothetical protein JKY51_03095 [Opitutaceae bacterium]|nr:hypothetical protein [Opitutaceae bacterium]